MCSETGSLSPFQGRSKEQKCPATDGLASVFEAGRLSTLHMATDVSLLQEVPLFSVLSEADRGLLATQLEEERFAQGTRIFHRGDPGGSVYVVCSGRVELSVHSDQGDRIHLETAEPGHFFGELSLLDGEPRSADAYAVEETLCLRIDRQDLQFLFRTQPDAALAMLTVMGKRLRAADALMRTRPERTPNQEVEQQRTLLQRLADSLAEFSGSLSFLAMHAIWFTIWMTLNSGLIPGLAPFDPFPFGLLTMVVSLEAIFLSCFVLISQSRTAAQDRIRSDVEYAANIKAALEVSQLHVKLDQLYEQTMQRMERIERQAQGAQAQGVAGRQAKYPV